ncbi:MAG: putative beta-lysine N-acetyltransferase, partial [Methanobacteriota archaeon]
MNDIIETIGSSILHHGKYNDRIYLLKLSRNDFPGILHELDELASIEKYSKIIAKVPSFVKDGFLKYGYSVEAFIPRFYNGIEDVYFMGKYFTGSRRQNCDHEKLRKILNAALNGATANSVEGPAAELPAGFYYKICDGSDSHQIAKVYRSVFETYPFPIHDPEYIRKTMDENFIYFSIRENNKIVALASTEMDVDSQNVEMTDFATLPEYQGNGFGSYLLQKMEDEMHKRNIMTAYTIARALSCGINMIFAKMGY